MYIEIYNVYVYLKMYTVTASYGFSGSNARCSINSIFVHGSVDPYHRHGNPPPLPSSVWVTEAMRFTIYDVIMLS